MEMIKSHKKMFSDYLLMTAGLALYTFSWSVFLIPSKIIGGGVSGISSIIYFMTGFPVGISNLFMNAVLFLVALKLLGAKFGVSTVFGIVASAGFFILFQQVIHIENFISISKFDPFMCCIIGGGLAGAGIGITFSAGGNSGGTDILALIINKYYNISPGKVILFTDIIIIGASWFVSHTIENVVYGYIQMVVLTYVIDLVLEGNKQSYQIMVFSQESAAIADHIGNEVKRGITLLDATGWYTKEDMKVLLVIARKLDKQTILRIIKSVDSKAFISVAKVQGVFGKNFDTIKL